MFWHRNKVFSPEGNERCWNDSLTKPIHLTLALNYTVLQQLFYWKLGIYTFAQYFLNKTAFLFKCFFGNTSLTLQTACLFSALGGGAEEWMMRLTPHLQWVELPGFYPALRLTAFESPRVWSLTQKMTSLQTDRGVWDCKTKAYFLNTAPEISSAKRVTDACSSLKKALLYIMSWLQTDSGKAWYTVDI